MERSDFTTIGMPRPHEKRRQVLVASPHQNSTWWKRFTAKKSDLELVLMKFLKPTSLKPAEFVVSSTGCPAVSLAAVGAAVFVTILDTIRQRIWPRPVTLITTLAVIVGLYFLVANGRGLHLNVGALFCLGCAALYAVYILYSDRLSRHGQATFNVSIWQLGVTGIEGLCLWTLTSGFQLPQTGAQWAAVLALGIICSAFGFVGQNAAQRYLTTETVR